MRSFSFPSTSRKCCASFRLSGGTKTCSSPAISATAYRESCGGRRGGRPAAWSGRGCPSVPSAPARREKQFFFFGWRLFTLLGSGANNRSDPIGFFLNPTNQIMEKGQQRTLGSFQTSKPQPTQFNASDEIGQIVRFLNQRIRCLGRS